MQYLANNCIFAAPDFWKDYLIQTVPFKLEMVAFD